MRVNNVYDVFGGIIVVALVTTIVTSRNTAGQITAAGNAMGGLIAASLGKGSIRR